ASPATRSRSAASAPPSGTRPPLRSFPTRRSSDLSHEHAQPAHWLFPRHRTDCGWSACAVAVADAGELRAVALDAQPGRAACEDRSEEHTSELQSQSNLVCRLLLEKKKRRQSRKCL